MCARWMRLLPGFLLLWTACGVSAAESPDLTSVDMQATMAAMEGKPLLGLARLEAVVDKNATLSQSLAQMRSFVGDWRGALRGMDEFYPQPKNDPGPFPDGLTRLPALDAIVEEARQHRVVIVNEAHHVAQHRAFIQQLLQRLRTEGFEYYAFETCGEIPLLLSIRGYPVRSTGYYSNEPVFGELIRESLRLRYKPVAYEAAGTKAHEDPVDDINAREEGQCRNLERLFKVDPKARVVIHVGFDHAMERPRKTPDGREILWMAARLAKATGLDPLTIDQVVQTERGEDSRASPEWRQALKNGWLDRPMVLRRADGSFEVSGHFAGLVDMQIFHPPTKLVDGRPDWMNAGGARVAVAIPDGIQAEPQRVLVQAFADRESDAAVPCDQLVLTAGEPRPKLLLRPGKYRIVVQDEGGKELSRIKLAVKREAD